MSTVSTEVVSTDGLSSSHSGDFKSALERRRNIKRMLDSGEERFVRDVLEQIADFLIGQERFKQADPSVDPDLLKLLAPATISALSEIGKLVDADNDEVSVYYPVSDCQLNAEGILVEALVNGTNDIQIAAATGLADIGTQLKSKPALLDRSNNDKNAFVRAKCEKAIRQIDERLGVKRLGGESVKTAHLYPHQIDAMVISAGLSAGIDMKVVVDGRFAGERRLQDGRLQDIQVITCVENPGSERQVSNQYLYVMAEIVAEISDQASSITALTQLCLRLNAGVLTPEDHKNDFEFSLGAIALDGQRLIFGQTLTTANLTVNALRDSLLGVSRTGDELKRFLRRRQDAI